MAVVRFAGDDVQRRCCDAAHMRRTLGAAAARVVSRRLQQLQAMRSLGDLDFMPFNSRPLDNGMVEVSVVSDLVLHVQEAHIHRGEEDVPVFVVNALCDGSAQRPPP